MIPLLRGGGHPDRHTLIRFLHSFRSVASHAPIPAKKARQMFLDFYIRDNHYSFVKSSPVVPFHDATVPFVNAGMNQFKSVFLNTHKPLYDKVANSQKCIRIGGKHNDLEAVGQDGYHHTFFEMLGNWTFKQCSKEEQCSLAWKLLTEVYKIKKQHLYVTYFGGNEACNLPADEECKEVWQKLGVPAGRIIPFGMEENFWEMGATGPCGPCTEIHYDHLPGQNHAQFVNKGMHELIELWNVVFIEYKREANGTMTPLPDKHVDTGMGFERLVAVLQRKISNYDTDVFQYLFKAIFKTCNNIPQYKSVFGEHDWNSLYSSYRILADHMRMITVSLADGMIPEENQKLRKVLRKAFYISETVFKKPSGLVKELSNYVIDNLGAVYPELESNSKQIHMIIDYEEDIYAELRRTATADWERITLTDPALANLDVLETPGLVQAYKDIKSANVLALTPKSAYRMYDTFGLTESAIAALCASLKIQFNPVEFRKEMAAVKQRTKAGSILDVQIPELADGTLKTEDALKYACTRTESGYEFHPVGVQVLKIIQNNAPVERLPAGGECALILDKTNLYHEAGGQVSDVGKIDFTIGEFHIRQLRKINDCILHVGSWCSTQELSPLVRGELTVDAQRRIANMRNHTATHLLNAVLKQVKGATCQKSSKVTDKFLNLDVGVFSEKLTITELKQIEDQINSIIRDGVPVNITETDSQSMLTQNVTVIPGEVYPEKNIRLVEINWKDALVSREPCCGTHVLNTMDIQAFCLLATKSLGRSTVSINALTGERAIKAQEHGRLLLNELAQLQKEVAENSAQASCENALQEYRQKLNSNVADGDVIPLLTKLECLKILDEIEMDIRDRMRNKIKNYIDLEMKSAVATKILKSDVDNKFIVHYLHTSIAGETVSLQKATKAVEGMPVMVITCADNVVKARCTVPENYKNDHFTAEKWMQVVCEIFKSTTAPPKGQNKDLVCNLKGKRVHDNAEWQSLLNRSLQAAEQYAKKHL